MANAARKNVGVSQRAIQGDGLANWEWTRLKISNLKPYPAPNDAYPNRPANGGASADDVNGARLNQVHVIFKNRAGLPEDTVIAGWHLVVAAKVRGEKEIEGFARPDLATASAAEIATEVDVFNSGGRSLSRSARAIRLKTLIDVYGRLPEKLMPCSRYRLKQSIGNLFGIGRRAIDRDLSLLRAPPAVQTAYDEGLVGHADAAAIGALDRRRRESIASRIAAGEDVVEVVKESLPPKTGRHKVAYAGFTLFLKDLTRGLADLEDRLQEIGRGALTRELPLLKRGHDFLGALIGRAQEEVAPSDSIESRFALLGTKRSGG